MITLLSKFMLAYLLGSVSGSLLLGRIRQVDIRTLGSGNAGGTNAFRTQGLAFALGVVMVDLGKAIVATAWIALLALSAEPGQFDLERTQLVCGFAVVLGHCFPLYHGFRGGKGAATVTGAILVIEPVLLVPMLSVWIMVLGLSGYVGLATVLAGFSLVPAALYLGGSSDLLLFIIAIALFMTFTHRDNLHRLMKGNENRFDKARIGYWLRR